MFGTAALGAVILGRTSGFVPWLAPAALALAVGGGGALLLARSGRASGRAGRRLRAVAAVAGTLALLAGPTAYSIATVGRSITGANPLAGPAGVAGVAGDGGPGGGVGGGPGGPPSGLGRFGGGFGPPPGAPALFGGAPPTGLPTGARRFGGGGGGPGGTVSKGLVAYLEAHQGTAHYLAAAVGSGTAAQLALQTGRDVIDMGGFMGSDPAPSLAKLQQLVASGQLHYVILGGGGGGPGGRSSATAARDAWITGHGKALTVSGQTVYYFAG